MKKHLLFLLLLLGSLGILAQAPTAFHYQAVIRNSDGTVKESEQVTMQIEIIQGTADGSAIYLEEHTKTTNAYGLVDLVIGDGSTSDDISSIDWNLGPYFLKVTVDNIEMGTSQLLSVPYAIHAKTADSLAYLAPGDIYDLNEQIDILLARMEALEEEVHYGDLLKTGFTDSRDNTQYNVVKIGSQVWMAENLKYLPEVHNNSDFATQGSNELPGYGVNGYDGDDVATAKSQANYDTYGVLYNWYALDQDNICPDGWHVPSIAEWTVLINYVSSDGHVNNEGSALKATEGWLGGGNGTDDYGFTALPGSDRNHVDGTFYDGPGNFGYWWSTTEEDDDTASILELFYYMTGFFYAEVNKANGLAVRCVMNEQ